ncbi:monovalent cation:proton antiporter-2 (CPA2) family protein [Fontimonas sp. SYSU GA230001]|uniref:monovalent cation:proton antiporter-2 (CPA2) family protein n=1 Tax=Fontimonas sp. SYSU GA230001 TaxID=3142450 RepID=UPI0032B30F80
MLADIALFLAAAVLIVPLFLRLRLGAVLGYLSAGIAIGPHGLNLIGGTQDVLHFAEFGVVLLLFIVGLELQPSRLWTLRRMVFGLGGAQVAVTGALLFVVVLWIGVDWRAATVAGLGLAMSSTAFVLQMLAERKELATHHGRAAFATLLFQDLAVIPMLALVPLLASSAELDAASGWWQTLKILVAFALVIFSGRYVVHPLMRAVAAVQTPELFTAAALLIVIATALAMDAAGLSMSLGAFLAGMLLSDSEFRHQLQADIEPFKGMLLGLFFIAVGMSADIGLLLADPLLLLELTAGLMLAKASILYVLGRASGLAPAAGRAYAAALAQGGEFAFVLFSVAVGAGVMSPQTAALLVVVVTLSMIATPLLYAAQARVRRPDAAMSYDTIDAPERTVLIAGFGPVGQIIARILRIKRIPFTVLDKDSQQVDFVRRFGNKIFYGDAGRLDLLRAAHADKASLFVLTIPDIEASLQVAGVVRRHFPNLRIFAIAVNRLHALRLMDLGITDVVRRSFFSSLEMSRELLQALGSSEDEARHIVETFREHDEATLKRQQAVAHDEKLFIQTAQDAARELEQLFEQDAKRP